MPPGFFFLYKRILVVQPQFILIYKLFFKLRFCGPIIAIYIFVRFYWDRNQEHAI
jgi:hypothetical protein